METPQMPHSNFPVDVQSLFSPTFSRSSCSGKPLPLLPIRTTYIDGEPYRDDPSQPPSSRLAVPPPNYLQSHAPFPPYTDLPSPDGLLSPLSTHNDDDVPLAQFLNLPPPQIPQNASAHPPISYYDLPYPAEEPPSYLTVVRESFRDTLGQYLPDPESIALRQLPVHVDEEVQLDAEIEEEKRLSIETLVAMVVLAVMLLALSAVFGWLAFGSDLYN